MKALVRILNGRTRIIYADSSNDTVAKLKKLIEDKTGKRFLRSSA